MARWIWLVGFEFNYEKVCCALFDLIWLKLPEIRRKSNCRISVRTFDRRKGTT